MDLRVIDRSGPAPARTVIVQRTPDAPLTLQPRRRRDALGARLFSAWLDPRLAAGVAPESRRLLAARAAQLVDPRARNALADAWDDVVVRATTPRRPADPRVPVARGAVLAAAADIAALSAVLRSPAPVAAREVARATALLTEGRSPVYTGGPALREAAARLVEDLAPVGW